MASVVTDKRSPVFAGRGTEMAVLARAFAEATAGVPGTVLIGAEAGGGKSRLVSEFTASVREKALVLAGGCVEVSGAGLPYAPFTALLRELVRSRGTDGVAALLPGGQAGELAMLLPEFGALPSGDPELTRARLFEVLLSLFEALAGHRPLVLVIEDAHWADRPTCDLLSFLVRNLRQAAVLLIVTFRSGGLIQAPFGALLGGLDRIAGVVRLELARLSRGQVGEQLAGILGRPPGPALTNAVYERGSGNPLFTEALANPDGTLVPSLPSGLRYALLATVRELPGQAQPVLRVAAVGGDRIGHGLLAAVTGLDDTALTTALRSTVAAHVLAADADGYAFRHQLFREAVLEDLLPGERAAAHRRYAEAIEAAGSSGRERGRTAQLALHWLGAGDDERALATAWQAAADAEAAFAYPQRLRMLDLVLRLWDRVPAAGRVGTDRAEVLELAVDTARLAGEPERGLALAEEAISVLGAAQAPERLAQAFGRRASLRRELLLPGQLEDLREALRLASAPTPVRAHVMTQLGWALRRADRHTEAERTARELSELATRLGDRERQAEATLLLAAVGAQRGEDTAAQLRAAREQAAALGAGQLEVWAYLTAGHCLEDLGRHELAIEVSRDGLARARQLGLGRQVAAPIAANLAESLTSAGRWDEAVEVVDEILSLDQPPLGRVGSLLVRGGIAARRGDLETAGHTLAELRALPAGLYAESHFAFPLAQLEIDTRLAGGDLAGALAAAGTSPPAPGEGAPQYQWLLLTAAMRACAEAAGARLDDVRRLRAELAEQAARVARRSPLHEAYAAAFAAEAARADGLHDLTVWDAAGAAWDSLGQPYPTAYALLQAARAAVATGDRDAAAPRIRRATGLAGQVGAAPLLQRIAQFARQARIDLPAGQRAAASARFGLTEREHEVLGLVAAGRGNRDIASELFISPKTASVHVSNILAKLGVSSRTEAAAMAHRLHLLEGHALSRARPVLS
jgi:DNA-binding CsgD family transcriptional regulator/tetratricopeptide (TPR) repeat protein